MVQINFLGDFAGADVGCANLKFQDVLEFAHDDVQKCLSVGLRFLNFPQKVLFVGLARIENEKFMDFLLEFGFVVHHQNSPHVTIQVLEGLDDLEGVSIGLLQLDQAVDPMV